MRFSVALFRRVTPPRVLPGTVLCGARTFLGWSRSPRRNRPARLDTGVIVPYVS
jgi:hypothetical protein